jgi:hypothetical protein
MTNDWQRMVFTFTCPTWTASAGSLTNVNCLVIRGIMGQDNTNQDIYITGAQLEVGDTATPFEHRSYGDELARCQRYYVSSISTSFYNNSVGAHIVRVALPVEMRTNPTVTRTGSFWSGSENAPNIYPQYGNKKAFLITGGTSTFLGGSFLSDAEL